MRTFGRSKVGKMKHLHIMTDSWNNMNIYTCWHGSTKLPIQLFMLCVQTCHLSLCSPSSRFVAHRGSQHTLSHTFLWFAPALIHPAAPAEQCQGREGRFQPSTITKASQASLAGLSSPQLCFLLAFAWSQRGSPPPPDISK